MAKPEADDAKAPEPEEEPQKIDTGDSVKVKQVMDEAVIRAVLDLGYEEDHKLGNWKLMLMAIACIFALVAQFFPWPFPKSRPLLAFCCVSYFLCSLALQLILTYIEQDTIMTTKPKGAAFPEGLRIRSSFPRFQDQYTVMVQQADKGATPVSETYSVGEFFDKQGYFDEAGVCLTVTKVLQGFEVGKAKTQRKTE